MPLPAGGRQVRGVGSSAPSPGCVCLHGPAAAKAGGSGHLPGPCRPAPQLSLRLTGVLGRGEATAAERTCLLSVSPACWWDEAQGAVGPYCPLRTGNV